MKDDPLIEEARNAGQAYIESFRGDRKAMIEDIRRREEAHRDRVVTLPAKLPRKHSA